MTVGELKSIIENEKLPDSAPVLVPASDHSYRVIQYAEFEATRATAGRQNFYCEYYDDETLEPGEVKIEALVLR